MNVEELERNLKAAIQKATSEGWTIKSSCWISKNRKCCCPLGAYFLSELGEWADTFEPLNNMRKLNLSESACYAFADGFDGNWNAYDRSYIGYWQLGKKFRDKYNQHTESTNE